MKLKIDISAKNILALNKKDNELKAVKEFIAEQDKLKEQIVEFAEKFDIYDLAIWTEHSHKVERVSPFNLLLGVGMNYWDKFMARLKFWWSK